MAGLRRFPSPTRSMPLRLPTATLLHGLLAITAFLFGWLYRRPPAIPDRDDDDEADDG